MSLAVTGATLDGETVGLRCEKGAIAAIGPDVVAEVGDETIDAGGMPLVPGLVNGHTHAAMTLFRGYGGDLPLMRWLEEKIWPVEAKLEAEDVYWGTRLACTEMIRTGTGRFWDMYWQPEATARAVEDAGMRATIGGPLFDADGRTAEAQARVSAELDALAERGPTIDGALAPHSIYTVSKELLRWAGEQAAVRGLAIQIHLSETEQEVSDCLAAHGERPTAYLDRLGLLGERTVLAHGVWLDEAELELIAALGTDGAGSNDSLDLFADLKVFALAQRHAAGEATVIPAAEALEIVTGARAPLLGGSTEPLSVGAPADFLLLRGDSPELGIGDLASDLVYAASGSIVDTTVVASRVLMRGGEVEGTAEIVAHAAERARRLGIR
jgi:5-methylthioadenosine/S-adenosylhomocysteine deaminase